MEEAKGNLFDYPADALVITTNGTVKKNGEAVMGRGVALQAAQKWPDLPRILGHYLMAEGNHVWCLRPFDRIYSFPVKHNWWEQADLDLIARSCVELSCRMDEWEPEMVVAMPRPGCGNGGLSWDVVRPILERNLYGARYVIVNNEE